MADNGASIWRDEAAVELVRGMWMDEGKSASIIAGAVNERFGNRYALVTRNSIVGLTHRKGWVHPSGRNQRVRAGRVNGGIRRERIRAAAGRGVKWETIKAARDAPADAQRARGRKGLLGAAVANAKRAAPPQAVTLAGPAPAHKGSPLHLARIAEAEDMREAFAAPAPEHTGEKRYIWTLRARDCRYAIGDDPEHRGRNTSRQFFCAAPTMAGQPYCGFHAELCYAPTKPLRSLPKDGNVVTREAAE